MLWLVTADLITAIHVAFVAFVVIGFVAIWVGWAARWDWVRNSGFRLAHLSMILFVCCESLIGATCPLTTWESAFAGRWTDQGRMVSRVRAERASGAVRLNRAILGYRQHDWRAQRLQRVHHLGAQGSADLPAGCVASAAGISRPQTRRARSGALS